VKWSIWWNATREINARNMQFVLSCRIQATRRPHPHPQPVCRSFRSRRPGAHTRSPNSSADRNDAQRRRFTTARHSHTWVACEERDAAPRAANTRREAVQSNLQGSHTSRRCRCARFAFYKSVIYNIHYVLLAWDYQLKEERERRLSVKSVLRKANKF